MTHKGGGHAGGSTKLSRVIHFYVHFNLNFNNKSIEKGTFLLEIDKND
jgi:hypothetical protein